MISFTLPGKAIAKIFGGGAKPLPLPEKPPPLPDRSDEEIQQRKREAIQQRKKRAGFGSAIQTSGLGVTDPANITKPSLLGGTGGNV